MPNNPVYIQDDRPGSVYYCYMFSLLHTRTSNRPILQQVYFTYFDPMPKAIHIYRGRSPGFARNNNTIFFHSFFHSPRHIYIYQPIFFSLFSLSLKPPCSPGETSCISCLPSPPPPFFLLSFFSPAVCIIHC